MQSTILARLFQLVTSDNIQVPLYDPATRTDVSDNLSFIKAYTADLLRNAFPNLNPAHIEVFVLGLCEYNGDQTRFKAHLRDFLIQLKEFQGDNADLYLEEKEAMLKEKTEREQNFARSVPGMVKPSEVMDDEVSLWKHKILRATI